MSEINLSDVVAGLDSISDRLENCVSEYVIETPGQLEKYHDALVREVGNLTSMLRTAISIIAMDEASHDHP